MFERSAASLKLILVEVVAYEYLSSITLVTTCTLDTATRLFQLPELQYSARALPRMDHFCGACRFVKKLFQANDCFLSLSFKFFVKKSFWNSPVKSLSFLGKCISKILDVFEGFFDFGFMAGPVCCSTADITRIQPCWIDYVESRDFSFCDTSMTQHELC